MIGLPPHVRKHREVRRVLLITLGLNWLVAGLKLLVGYGSGALAMVADGYHSLLDGSSNVVGLIAIHYAYKPADEDHRYGHHKFETVSGMAISIGLFSAAWQIVGDAFGRLSAPVLPEVGVATFAVMAVTLLVNLGVSRYERREGRRLSSHLLVSDAAHTGSDVYASLAVVAALVAARLGYPWLDVAASLLIAGLIVRTGYAIVRSGLSVISDQTVLDAAELERAVLEVEGVRGCERIRSRGTGDHVFVDLTLRVSGELTLVEAHALADRIEAHIQARFPAVQDIVVHVEPA